MQPPGAAATAAAAEAVADANAAATAVMSRQHLDLSWAVNPRQISWILNVRKPCNSRSGKDCLKENSSSRDFLERGQDQGDNLLLLK